MPLSRRRSKHRHRAAHGTEHPVQPVPAWTDDEQWFEPDDAHPGWAGQLHHEPAPWRSEEPEWVGGEPPGYSEQPSATDSPARHRDYDYPPREYALPDDYPPPQNYPGLPIGSLSPAPGYPAPAVDPRGEYPPQPEYSVDDYDEGYEQHGPDETPALRGRLIRLPRRHAELPEAVRDCLHWGIFALVLVPVFLVATGGSVLNAIVVMISILVLGVVVIWVVRLGKIALPNLEPSHQLEPLAPEVQDPAEDEWEEAPESDGRSDWPEPPAHGGDWPEPPAHGGDWPGPPGPDREWPEPSWEPYLPPQPGEREHVGWRRDQ
ncbi:MAG TPA: hypothetical protein VKE25_10130 [Actinomycetes bacterium]|nr:hypothetical protein [Actinomycetes bacterium]